MTKCMGGCGADMGDFGGMCPACVEGARMLNKMAIRNAERRRRNDVTAFHMKYGHPVNLYPFVPHDEQIRFRLKLIAEEFFELLDAAGIVGGAARDRVREYIDESSPSAFKSFNFPEFVDALADLDYVIEGTRLVFGVDGEPIAAEVHRANMDKDAAYVEAKDAHHALSKIKPVKPAGWKPPDIEGELKKQGWKP